MHFCISSNHHQQSLREILTFEEQPFGVSEIGAYTSHVSKRQLRELKELVQRLIRRASLGSSPVA